MNKGLVFLYFVAAVATGIFLFPNGAVASLAATGGTLLILAIISFRYSDLETRRFLSNIFLSALLIRLALGVLIYAFGLEEKFGPDAFTYDIWGTELMNYWWGVTAAPMTDFTRVGWGMPYIVASVYFFTGSNPLVIQIISCLLGAATAVLAYETSREIFANSRVARYTAIFVAFFPAMIIWTSQALKEGFIIFFLVLGVLAALHLLKQFSIGWVINLLVALSFISILRFYIFFMVIIAVFGGFILSAKASAQSLVSRFAACLLIGIALAYMGVLQISSDQLEKYGTLDKVQSSREWASRGAKSGVNEENDIRTSEGLVSALPSGMANLLLAPFPWQVSSLTQALTMPEMIIWWASLPFLFTGLAYTIKTRLRESVSILFFTLILSVSYALYQGNLGTIYRQRAQIQVFLLLFIAVGFVLRLEKRENTKALLKSQRFSKRVFAR